MSILEFITSFLPVFERHGVKMEDVTNPKEAAIKLATDLQARVNEMRRDIRTLQTLVAVFDNRVGDTGAFAPVATSGRPIANGEDCGHD